ncbi:MAG: phosphotransferase [Oscillospiraceae bacterium]|nr:phosphotransferase [Oscillospiraceae bacterium]
MSLDNRISQKIYGLYRIDKDSIKSLNEYGELFECAIQGQPFILRMTDYKTFEEQNAEADFINYLYDNGVNVANVIPSENGNLVEKIEHVGQEIYAVLFSKAKGHHATSEEWNSALIDKCGQIIGKMHVLSKKYPNTSKSSIIDWYEHDEMNYLKHVPSKHTVIIEKCNALFDEIKALPRNENTYGLIHSDVAQVNFFLDNDRITLIDFQDCEHNYFINDLAVMIYFGIEDSFNGNDIKSYSSEFIAALLKGYSRECTIEPFWIEKIPLFLKLIEIHQFVMFYCYWDVETFDEDRKARLNIYRKNIEYDIPVLDVDFKSFYW